VRYAIAVEIDARDRAHGFTVAVGVPVNEHPRPAMRDELDARWGRQDPLA
jgi:hypothetical protein